MRVSLTRSNDIIGNSALLIYDNDVILFWLKGERSNSGNSGVTVCSDQYIPEASRQCKQC